MKRHRKRPKVLCPVTTDALVAEARQRFEKVLSFCLVSEHSFLKSEKCLLALLALLGRLLVRLWLTSRHERLDLKPYLQDGVGGGDLWPRPVAQAEGRSRLLSPGRGAGLDA